MTIRRRARPSALLGALCAACALLGATAAQASARASRVHRGHGARACHHTRRHRCKRKRSKHAAPKSVLPKSVAKAPGTTAPWPGLSSPLVPPPTPEAVTTPVSPAESQAPGEESTPPSGPAHVQVTAEDTEAFRFVLSRPTVPTGEVMIEFVNHGQDEHNMKAVEAPEGAEAGSIPNTAPNAHPTLTLDMRPGSYTLFCTLPTHEARGMKATLVVE